jgi:hypothetical protein
MELSDGLAGNLVEGLADGRMRAGRESVRELDQAQRDG